MTSDASGFLGLFWIFFLGFFRGTFGRGLVVDFEVVFGAFEVFKSFFGSWLGGLGVEGLVFEGLSDFSKRFGVGSPFGRDFEGFFGRFLSRYFCMSRAVGGFLD